MISIKFHFSKVFRVIIRNNYRQSSHLLSGDGINNASSKKANRTMP